MPEFAHRLIFLRHGETAYNAENRLQGQLDIPLNARGRDQARPLGRTLVACDGCSRCGSRTQAFGRERLEGCRRRPE